MKLIRTASLAAASLCSFATWANTCVPLQAGAADQTVYLEFIDETTGVPNSSLAFNSSGIDLEYVRSGAAATDITEVTQTAGGAHADGGFVSVGHGRYRLDLPDAAVASGVPQVVIQGVITGYIMLPCAVALSPPANVFAWNGTALATTNPLPNAAPGASGGLPILGANAGNVSYSGTHTYTGNVAYSDGITITRSTANQPGWSVTGNGTGAGMQVTSGNGATGNGANFVAASTNGNGVALTGTGTGNGATYTGGSTSGEGAQFIGGGTGSGIIAQSGSGATGSGVVFAAGSTNGAGFRVTGTGNVSGVEFVGGSTGGDGFRITAGTGTGGHGISASGDGVGSGIIGFGGATGDGVEGVGGGTSGAGARYAATAGNSSGAQYVGQGTGNGATFTSGGGATGNGAQFTAASTNGSGIGLTPTGTGTGINGTLATVTNLTNAATNGDLTATMKASVNTEVDTGLADINLDHLVGTGTGIPAIPAGTYFDQLTDDGTSTFDRTTESLQALRDRLDSQIAEVFASIGRRTTITVTDQDTFTLAAGATFNDAYLGWGVKINDAGSQDEWLGKVEAYVGSTKTVELNRVSGFTIATGDTVMLYPAFLYDPPDNADLNCTVNTANFAGSTTTLACILTDTDGAAVTSASGKLTGAEIEILTGAQAREKRYVFSTTWDGTNNELQITLDRALPATLADAVTAIIR